MGKFYTTFKKGQVHIVAGTALNHLTVAVWDEDSWSSGQKTASDLFKGEFSKTYFDDEWSDEMLKEYPLGFVKINTNNHEKKTSQSKKSLLDFKCEYDI